MAKLDQEVVRRALLQSLANGSSQRAACAEAGMSRNTLTRYTERYPGFAQHMREAIALREVDQTEVTAFLDKVTLVHPSLMTCAEPEQIDPPVVTPVIVADVVHKPPPSERSKAAFYEKLWQRFEDPLTPLLLQVESTRALERHYLREDVLGAPDRKSQPRRPRGISAAAKREVIHSLIGPKPASREDESKDVG